MLRPEMTLDDFVATMKARLDQFALDWRAQQKADPEHWPATMPFPDWWEQFEIDPLNT